MLYLGSIPEMATDVLFNQLDTVALDAHTICKYLYVTTKKGFYYQTGRKAVLSREKL